MRMRHLIEGLENAAGVKIRVLKGERGNPDDRNAFIKRLSNYPADLQKSSLDLFDKEQELKKEVAALKERQNELDKLKAALRERQSKYGRWVEVPKSKDIEWKPAK